MQVSDLHELDQIHRVEQEKDRPKNRSLWYSIQYLGLNGELTAGGSKCEPAENSAANPIQCLESLILTTTMMMMMCVCVSDISVDGPV